MYYKVPVWMVGPHPENRESMGLIVDNVHTIGDDVVNVGCSSALIDAERILIEDDPDAMAIRAFGANLVKSHEGFAPIGDQIRFGSCSNSRFNHTVCISNPNYTRCN